MTDRVATDSQPAGSAEIPQEKLHERPWIGLGWLERLIFDSRTWVFLTVFIALTIIKTGIWMSPILQWHALLAKNPFSDPFVGNQAINEYLLYSWLSGFVSWLVGARDVWSMFWLHLAFQAGFIALGTRIAFKRFPPRAARTSVLLFLAIPATSSGFYWVGLDSLTCLLLGLALTFTRWRLVTMFFGILLGMQHFEQTIIAAGIYLVVVIVTPALRNRRPYDVWFGASLVVGTLLGKGFLTLLFAWFNFTNLNGGRVFWVKTFGRTFLGEWFTYPTVLLLSVLGVLWFLVLRYFEMYRKYGIILLLALGVAWAASSIVNDHSRISSNVALIVAACLFAFNPDIVQSLSKRAVAVGVIFWAFYNSTWMVGVHIWGPNIGRDIVLLVHVLVPGVAPPADLFSAP